MPLGWAAALRGPAETVNREVFYLLRVQTKNWRRSWSALRAREKAAWKRRVVGGDNTLKTDVAVDICNSTWKELHVEKPGEFVLTATNGKELPRF